MKQARRSGARLQQRNKLCTVEQSMKRFEDENWRRGKTQNSEASIKTCGVSNDWPIFWVLLFLYSGYLTSQRYNDCFFIDFLSQKCSFLSHGCLAAFHLLTLPNASQPPPSLTVFSAAQVSRPTRWKLMIVSLHEFLTKLSIAHTVCLALRHLTEVENVQFSFFTRTGRIRSGFHGASTEHAFLVLLNFLLHSSITIHWLLPLSSFTLTVTSHLFFTSFNLSCSAASCTVLTSRLPYSAVLL